MGVSSLCKAFSGRQIGLQVLFVLFCRISKGKCWILLLQPNAISKNTNFLKRGHLLDRKGEAVELDEVHENGSSQDIQINPPDTNKATSEAPTENTQPLRRSKRIPKEPERWLGLLQEKGTQNPPLYSDPKSFKSAMSDIDSRKWLEAMTSEMDSMYSNKV